MTSRQRSRGMPRRTDRPSGRSRMPIIVIGAVVAIVLIAAVGAVVATSGDQQVGQPAARLDVSGTALTPLPSDGSADPAIGQRLPTLSGTGIDGQAMTISADGNAKVVVILAHWCSHCRAEVPLLVDWLDANTVPDNVDIVALTTAIQPTGTNYPPSAWLDREGWQQPTLVDDANNSGLNALGVANFPGFVLVSGDGRVQQRLTGEISMDQFAQAVAGLSALSS